MGTTYRYLLIALISFLFVGGSSAQAGRTEGIRLFSHALSLNKKIDGAENEAEKARLRSLIDQIAALIVKDHLTSPPGLALRRGIAHNGLDISQIRQALDKWVSANPDWQAPVFDVTTVFKPKPVRSTNSRQVNKRDTRVDPGKTLRKTVRRKTERKQEQNKHRKRKFNAFETFKVPTIETRQTEKRHPVRKSLPTDGNETPAGNPFSEMTVAQLENMNTFREKKYLRRLENYTKSLTVFVDDGTGGHGTGFFIADNIIMTNAHVVSFLDTDLRAKVRKKVFVVNELIGRQSGEVIYVASPPKAYKYDCNNNKICHSYYIAGLDVALIQLHKYRSPHNLTISSAPERGDDIFVWGYPGANTLDKDRNYQRYKEGLATAPSITIAKGGIQSLLPAKNNGLELLQHSAKVEGGNSGSPILNMCGHVVGIHFSGLAKRGERFAYAYSSREIIKDMAFKNHMEYTTTDRQCPI